MRRTAGFLVALVLFAAPPLEFSANAQPLGTASTVALAATSGTSAAAWYRALDTALVDTFSANRLLDPMTSPNSGQRCLRTDNAISIRPSPVANLPLPEAAIAQRRALVEALAAYSLAIASFASREPSSDTTIALSAAQQGARNLNVAAHQHAAGDLFIEDLAAAFSVDVERLAQAGTTADKRKRAIEAQPTSAKLTAILNADALLRRAQSLNAARLDYQAWLAVYDARRATLRKDAVARPSPAPIPRCFEPALSANGPPLVPRDVASDGEKFAGRQSIVVRLAAARERYTAIERAHLTELLASLADLNGAAIDALAGNARSDVLHAALSRVRATAQTLATAVRPLH